MKETDTITVLICVHSQDADHDALLQRALESLVRQSYDDFRVVIVMDECWSYTRRVVESYMDTLDIQFYERHKKQGLASAKNFALARIDTDWIAYLDADDQFMDCKLEVQRNWLLDRPEVDFCGTHAWDVIDGYVTPNCFDVRWHQTHDEIARRLVTENVMCHGSMMIRTSALRHIGGYNTDKSFLGREDWELWCRALQAGFTFSKVPERLYLYSLGTSVPR